ncbi:hypothetical protein [Oceanisphaera arctica]|uniref:Preprotein translocase subunit SecY n=1 Tax=Oceanisphaera arctica TaxID=641510 RepID=A0A2P5TP89_9GAMM|nr:hypothetical protein [Oceanisphaera arctica]PPL17462.1 hypothetical protein UN63_05360 [Oceanisphaera arctica]GHA07821.1 hypothetical protein GCM10007082_05880 [Oceanisphaera arctica]
MHYQRLPKGHFALSVVYLITGASIAASMVFSLLLFLSLEQGLLMKLMFGGLALVFEVGKFYIWYEMGERTNRGDSMGSLKALCFYAVLSGLSIAGSVGGINAATNTLMKGDEAKAAEVQSYNDKIVSLDREIEINEQAAQAYIDMKRIANGMTEMLARNQDLRARQDELRRERDQVAITSQSSLMGLMSSLADGLGWPLARVQFGIVAALSVLLDFFAAFFISLLGEETRFRRSQRQQEQQAATTSVVPAQPAVPARPDYYHELVARLQAGELRCAKGAVSRMLEKPLEEVEDIFHWLLQDGIVYRKPNRHFALSQQD